MRLGVVLPILVVGCIAVAMIWKEHYDHLDALATGILMIAHRIIEADYRRSRKGPKDKEENGQ